MHIKGLMRRSEIRLGLRVTVAAVLSYAVGEGLGLAQSFWAVLTSVIVMQANVGGSLKATIERLMGTLGGSIWGVAVCLVAEHWTGVPLALALGLAVAPLALLSALRPAYRVAPVTAVIVLTSALSGHLDPLTIALHRLAEIGLGCAVALIVSLAVLPARAHGQLTETAAEALSQMAALMRAVPDLLTGSPQQNTLAAHQAMLRASLARLDTIAQEAQRERVSHLSDGPDPAPLTRTLRRLRSDLILMARAAAVPFPETVAATLEPSFREATGAAAQMLSEAGANFGTRAATPAPDDLIRAVASYGAAIAHLRAQGLMRPLDSEVLGRLFGLSFAFEQIRDNLHDLAQRSEEFARWRAPLPLPVSSPKQGAP